MSSAFDARRAEPRRLVGRRLELSWLHSRLQLCTRGFPHLVLLEGEVGVGKTRLADELLIEARRAGFGVYRGRCYEHLELAYLPLRESLLPALAAHRAGRPDHEADATLLARIDADVEEPAPSDPSSPRSGEQARTRQLLTLTRWVLELARDAPSVVFIDDVDWADAPTIDLLRHLLFRCDGSDVSLLVLVTCRGDALARAAEGVAALRLEPRCATVALGPLPEFDAVELARELIVAAAVGEARRVAIASGGNPLLLQAIVPRPDAPPWSPQPAGGPQHPMTAAITHRLAGLGADARAVVDAAAFLIPHSTGALIGAVTGLDPEPRAAATRAAVDATVLTTEGDTIAFTHPLYAHLVHEGMPAPARRRFHQQIAAALIASRDAGTPVPGRAIAHHLVAGGPGADRALNTEYVGPAGDEAMGLGAWGEAVRFYEATLAGIDTAPSTETVELHRRTAICCRYDLQLAAAVAHLDRAIEQCPTDDLGTLTELHLLRIRCGLANRELFDLVAERAPLEHLVEQVADEHPGLAASGLVELSQAYWMEGRVARAEATATRAIEIAERVDDHAVCCRATIPLTVVQWMRYDLSDSLVTLDAGVAHARAAVDRSMLVGGPLFRIPLALTWLGRLDEATARAQEACAVAEELRAPLELGIPLGALAQLAVARGDFDAAERYAHQALSIQRLSGYQWAAGLFLPALAAAYVARGRYEAARDALRTWSETADPLEQLTIDLLHRYVDVLEHPITPNSGTLPAVPRAPMVGADTWTAALVEIARHQDAAVDIARARELLVAVEERGGVLIGGLALLVPRIRGVAADLAGDTDDAIATLRRAIGLGDQLGVAPERARAQVDLATILLRRGAHDEARELLTAAAETFTTHGMISELDRTDALLGGHAAATARSSLAEELGSVTTVILFTDVVDSTRLTDELGNVRYRYLARELEELVTARIVAHGGTVVTGINLGDGFIGLFPTADRAVAAAQSCAREAGSTGLHLHLSVHAGSVVVDGPRIFGSAVNLAARICGVTAPDEILVSDAVRDRLPSGPGVEYIDRGAHTFKGIATPQRIYEVVAAAESPVG